MVLRVCPIDRPAQWLKLAFVQRRPRHFMSSRTGFFRKALITSDVAVYRPSRKLSQAFKRLLCYCLDPSLPTHSPFVLHRTLLGSFSLYLASHSFETLARSWLWLLASSWIIEIMLLLSIFYPGTVFTLGLSAMYCNIEIFAPTIFQTIISSIPSPPSHSTSSYSLV